MTFRRGGGKKRRDANEPEILDALRRCGYDCWQVGGTGLPDLLVRSKRCRTLFYALEVKTETGRLTDQQGAFPVVRSVSEAMAAVRE